MLVGLFEYDLNDDTYSGDISAVTFSRAVVLLPVEKAAEREPDYRVVDIASSVEFGAAWKRTRERGRDFLSVSLDDPTLGVPFNAALFSDKRDPSKARLIWTRPKAKLAVETALKTPTNARAA